MEGMSEDEGDPDDEPEIKIDEEKNEAARKAREERAERLRKMMEDDGKPLKLDVMVVSNVYRRGNARRASHSRITSRGSLNSGNRFNGASRGRAYRHRREWS
jgi:hypothetical protein